VAVSNPILRREGFPRFWRRSSPVRRKVLLAIYLIVAALPMLALLKYWRAVDAEAASIIILPLSYWPTFLAPVIAPALAAGAIASERERRTWDVLVVSRLTSSEIIWGKLLSRLTPLLWITIPLLPVMVALLIRSGGANPWGQWATGGFAGGSNPYAGASTWPLMAVGWLSGFMVTFANAVMALYVSFRCSSTRAALLTAYGVAVGAYFVVTMVIGGISMAIILPTMMGAMSSPSSAGPGAAPFPPHVMTWMMALASAPPFLWGLLVPAILLPIMVRRFPQLDSRVRAG